ncbi:MAG TPA: phosphomannomutase/phosphoglucomutase [Candidatus Babeliales bacterium]|nr:phosphomannomutase/phosphoglucomutase [Candidatus Babeliales bacterium]
MLDSIFREYDIRGKVGSELLVEEAYNLARSIAYFFHEKRGSAVKTVALGMDGRLHSEAIKNEVVRGLTDSGLNVLFLGICPSPVLYFALYNLPVDAGLMITASHNPKEYNGLKICLGKDSVWGVQVREIRDLYKAGKQLESSVKGTVSEYPAINDYITWMGHSFKHLKGMDFKVIVDCGNGAAGAVMPALIKEMAWPNVQLLYPEIDGTYPNHEADPVKEKNMQDVKKILTETSVELGIGLDGDVDRMVPMTKSGYLVPGDKLLSVFAQPIVKEHPGAAVVMDIKSSSGLIDLLNRWGAKPCLSPSGHAIVKDQIRQHNALLGGELSCHFFFKDRYFGYDDGIYAMLRLFEILSPGISLDALLTQFPKKFSSREILISCPDEKKRDVVENVKQLFAQRTDVTIITIDGVRATMDYGWGILRASNTTPMLSLRFESDTEQGLQQVKLDFFKALEHAIDPVTLREHIGIEGIA